MSGLSAQQLPNWCGNFLEESLESLKLLAEFKTKGGYPLRKEAQGHITP